MAAIMIQGCGSDVGKSVLVAGLCRLFTRHGLRVRPFKPQNMSNNAAVTAPDSQGRTGEIGRAQALQAMACRTPPTVDMNPVLLKPQSDTGTQLVVRGQVQGSWKASGYQAHKTALLDVVLESFKVLKAESGHSRGSGQSCRDQSKGQRHCQYGLCSCGRCSGHTCR